MNSTKDSMLLALAPELRNSIYDFVVSDCDNVAFVNDRILTNSFALIATCRQIKDEFTPIWRHAIQIAANIEATITDFNFDGLTRFYAQLQPLTAHTRRKLTVNINLAAKLPCYRLEHDPTRGNMEAELDEFQHTVLPLQTWLRRCISPQDGHRGVDGCEIEYVVRVDLLRWSVEELSRLAWRLRRLIKFRGWSTNTTKIITAVFVAAVVMA